jgi:aspartyl-tRNA(Asn)/glutamyl-tRNA(Gln) amidotransferase subunit A
VTEAGNLAGLPAVAVPIGFGRGRLPASLQLLGRAHSEERLVAIASAYQEMTDWHRQSPDPRGARVDLGQ